jgi:DNA repair exonuclease SbcCD ATPase subunit
MRIERIRLVNYRGVAEHEIELRGGVTVIEGANEAGKSSLVEAIDLLLNFRDDSRDRRVEAVRPVHTGAAPEVEIDFVAGPYRFTYAKRWSHKASEAATALQITQPQQDVVRGREAHERALQILDEHADLDLWRALRVLQDEALDQPRLDQKSALMRALDTAAGTGADSDAGDQRNTALIDAAAREYRRYFTAAKGSPTDEYQKAITALDGARDEVQKRLATLDRVQEDIEEHRRTEQKLGKLQEAERTGGPALAKLEARHRELEAAAARAGQLQNAAKFARLEAGTAAAALAAREDLRGAEQVAAAEAVKLAEQAERAEADVEDKRPPAAAARQAAATARDAQAQGEAAASRAAEDRDHLRELDELGRLTERAAKAQAAGAKARRCAAELAAIRIDEEAVKRLEKEYQKVVKAQASAEAASSLVEISAVDGARTLTLDVNGEPAPTRAGGMFSRRLSDDTTLVIDNSIRIRIAPGSAERDQLVKLVKVQDDFTKSCIAAGATGIEHAREQLSQRRELEADLATARATISAALDGQDVETVGDHIAAVRARADRYRAARAAQCDEPMPESPAAARVVLERANEALKQARAESDQAEAVADALLSALGKAETEARMLRMQADDAAKRAQQSAAKIAAARTGASDEDLLASRDELAREAELAEQHHVTAAAQFDAEELTAVATQLVNEHAVAKRREDEMHQCALTLTQLGAKLANDRDAQERLNDAQARLLEAEQEHERVRRRAMAAKRLYGTLTDKRDVAKRAYVEPFRRKLEQFARIVFDGQLTLVVDDNLAVTHRILNGAKVPYHHLSGGAREQIALCARLACAALVDPEDGVPVVIDDALGFTDPERLHRIGAVFSAAENRSQVIVLTCMPDRYRGIGVADVIQLRRSVPAAGATHVD